MALTDLERLRLAVADRPRVTLREQVGTGNGTRTQWQVQLYPVESASETVLVNETPVVTYTLDDATGLLTFTAAPANNATVIVTYRWTTFSDAELNDLLDRGLSVTRAAIQVIRWLLADTERFIKYTFGQESVDRSATREGLEKLLDRLEKEAGRGAVALVKVDTPEREALLYPFVGTADDQWSSESIVD
mgnify:CR=1 FL=1